jgi:hypothetical protein
MSVPPPPNQWGPSPGDQPGGDVPQWGPNYPWGPPPGSPPSGGGKGKWIVIGIAVIAVIAVTVVITVLVVGKDSGGGESPTPTNGNGSDFASANDKGPVGIITDDPTCAGWNRIADGLSAQERNVDWADRDKTIPATSWTPQQRTTYETVAKAMRTASDQTVGLAKATSHRVMRELYVQFGAYVRAFDEKFQTYTADDRHLPEVVDGFAASLVNVCAAITYGVAQAQASLIPPVAAPSELAPVDDPSNSPRFVTSSGPVCSDWASAFEKFDADTANWRTLRTDIPADQWTPEQKAVNDAVVPTMNNFADDLEHLGRSSSNAVLEDFAVLSAQYRRAYVLALPSYTSVDNYLANASTNLVKSVYSACEAGG